jgi:hypothetical protein
VGRLTRWTDKLWSRRYDHGLVTDEEGAQVKRLSYVLSKDYASHCTSCPGSLLASKWSTWYMHIACVTDSFRILPSAAHC